MVNLSGIQEFVAVAQKGSFTQAAQELHCSKSHVSRQVKALEQRLGVLLLDRTTRGVRLTEPGEAFFVRCVSVLSELGSMTDALSAAAEVPRGALKVHVAAPLGDFTVADIFIDFAVRHPEIRLGLNFSSRPLDTWAGDYDALVTRGRLKDSGLVARKLGESDFGLYASPAYFERHGVPTSVGDLVRHNCLADESETWSFDSSPREVRVKVRGNLTSNRASLLLRGAIQGSGIIQLPSFPLRNLVEKNILVPVPGAWARWRTSWYVLFPKRVPPAPNIRLLVDFLAGHFADPDRFRALGTTKIPLV